MDSNTRICKNCGEIISKFKTHMDYGIGYTCNFKDHSANTQKIYTNVEQSKLIKWLSKNKYEL